MDRSEAEAIVRRDLPMCVEALVALMPVEPADMRLLIYEEMFEPSVAGILDGTIHLVGGRLTLKPTASAKSRPNPQAN
jgi:hypothetical protein